MIDTKQAPAEDKQESGALWSEPWAAMHDDYLDLTSPIKEVSQDAQHPHDTPSIAVVDAALNRLATDDIEDCFQPPLSPVIIVNCAIVLYMYQTLLFLPHMC